MIFSMTGYAVKTLDIECGTLQLEFKSVNSRYLDFHFRIAEDLRSLEIPLRELLSSRLSRGKIECRLGFNSAAARADQLQLNQELFGTLKALNDNVRIQMPEARPLSVSDVLRWPGMFGEQGIDFSAVGPQVLALASSQLRDRPNWAAGVAVSWTLWSSIDRDQLSRATLKDIEQADLTDAQARSDIQLLVERQWRAVDNARRQFMAFDAHLAEGDELLRLRRAGLREGTSTALALIDAETRQAQRRTERAQIAYQYIQALAGLLHASGQPRDITRYLARPDAVFIKPTDAPAP